MRVFRVLWPLISLPMILSFCYIYNTTRSFGSTMWRSAAKCGATFVAVITAVLGIVLFNRPANAWLLALALLFCCIADFVIERDFRFGVISFGLAPCAYRVYCTARRVSVGHGRCGFGHLRHHCADFPAISAFAWLYVAPDGAVSARAFVHDSYGGHVAVCRLDAVDTVRVGCSGVLHFGLVRCAGFHLRHYGHTEKRCADPILPRRVRDGVDTALFVKLFWGNLNGTNFEKYIGK